MRILGLDTSGKMASVAILDTEKQLLLCEHTVYTSRTHSQVIMPMCKALLSECNLTIQDINCFAVAVGPGSYTGLRIGISAVQGMAMVNHTACVGVSTLAGLASRIGNGTVLAIMHAREDLFYYGIYCYDYNNNLTKMPMGELASVSEIIQVITNMTGQLIITGDGAEKFLQQLELIAKLPDNLQIILAPVVLRLQSAVGVCLCATHAELGTASDLTASYLQAVQIQKKKKDR
ncbi:MAG: tRNA (adenosine(37)-N6)-threonylcarbamoyltransferase complex dimerization subunit type 1 TsaB [Oscillospiraceae bacterium]|nr:tRNA (adenosine(37)-N6)-threonylcarbamoyltransferase complex dimerization subunit type 1 TsaB [Oscillospiraceae bacterium]